MPSFAAKTNRRYTLSDYQAWPDSERWELIDGAAYMMSPSPSRGHQDLVLELAGLLREFLKGKPCKPVVAPYDVKFGESTVVQPDITVWCAPKDAPGADQTPAEELSVVVEVLSPSSASYDLVEKLSLYEKQGVPEYWVVSSDEKRFIRFSLHEGRYIAAYYPSGEFKSEKLAGFGFNVEAFFDAAAE